MTDSGAAATREHQLARTFVELADTLVSGFDMVGFLDTLTVRSIQLLGLAAAGVLLDSQRGPLRAVAASDERVHLLELLELQNAEGPCLEAFSRAEPVQAAGAEALARWPRFAAQAAAFGYGTLCALPLRLRDHTIGALNLFRAEVSPLDPAELVTGQALADVATIGLLQERAVRESRLLGEQLQAALNSRVTIEQAKGMLVEQTGREVNAAFDLMRRYARRHNLRLADIAQQVVAGALHASVLERT